MNWYVEVLKKYATFSGRARRTEYWMFVLVNLLVSIALGVGDAVLGTATDDGTGILGSIYALGVLLPSIAVGVRRLHDMNKSGWWMLLAIVPLVNVVLLVFFVQQGTVGPNRYGPDPKTSLQGAAVAPSAAAGWHVDPTGRHQLRYWDAQQWTSHVSDNGVASTDSL